MLHNARALVHLGRSASRPSCPSQTSCSRTLKKCPFVRVTKFNLSEFQLAMVRESCSSISNDNTIFSMVYLHVAN